MNLSELILLGEQTLKEVEENFTSLNEAQLNWKENAEKWSIAQCLSHLVETNSSYFDTFEKIVAGKYTPSFWTKYSPFSGFFGKFVIESVNPIKVKPIKVPTQTWQPTSSNLSRQIVPQFIQNQKRILDKIHLMSNLPLTQIKLASPANFFLTYSLSDAFEIIILHGQRHVNQAKKVKELMESKNQT
jgi:hypothetical protein